MRNKIHDSFLAALMMGMAAGGFEFNTRQITLPREPDPNLDSADLKIATAQEELNKARILKAKQKQERKLKNRLT